MKADQTRDCHAPYILSEAVLKPLSQFFMNYLYITGITQQLERYPSSFAQ